MYHPSFGKFETTTGGEYTSVKIGETGVEFEQEDSVEVRELPEHSLELCTFLIERANEPYLATEIKREAGIETPVARSFETIRDSLGEVALKNHFIKLGGGKATWYGFVDDDSQESKLDFVEVGLTKIELDAITDNHTERRRKRREKPFVAYKDFLLNGEREPFFTRNKKIAGATALAISVGAVTVYVTRHFRH